MRVCVREGERECVRGAGERDSGRGTGSKEGWVVGREGVCKGGRERECWGGRRKR